MREDRSTFAFTGSGEDLRRHLRRDRLVNLLLGGLYTPVVRRRQARYLASNTALDGTSVQWTDVPRSRLPALLLLLLFVGLRVAGEFGEGPPMPLVIAGGVLMLPYLWAVSAARSLDALSWRGMHLRFTATWPAIYRASWPLFALGLPWAVAQPWVTAKLQGAAPDLRWLWPISAVALVAYPLLVRQGYEWHRLRVSAATVDGHAVRSPTGFGPYLRQWLATTALVLVTAVAPVLLLRHLLGIALTPADPNDVASLAVPLVAAMIAFLLSTPARAWHEARMFRLWWDGARVGGLARIECRLDAAAFTRLRTPATARALLTLGRSRSEAAVAAWRMKLDSLTVGLEGPPR
ncbi:DUF898 family protein [Ramlibacter humi]|nr:DUF898 family protein [Ramlibacter humi]